MKIFQKISRTVVLVLAFLGTAVLLHAKASAASGITADQLSSTTYKGIAVNEIDATIAGSTVKFIDSNIFDSTYNYKPQSSLFCDGTTYGNSDASKGITLNTSFSALSNNTNSLQATANLDYKDTNGDCQNYQGTLVFTKNSSGAWVATGITATGGTTTGPAGSSDNNACEGSSNTGLEWLVCGVLRGIGGLIDSVNGQIEKQLSFDVPQNLNSNVHQAWSVFRTISSALLVIIMLVMVFSQAVSAGPFDAYTVKKLMPRLIAAVILIQLSWFLSIWVINLANDLGSGIADLISAPFGGTAKLNISDLIGNINGAAAGTTVGVGFLATTVAVLIDPFGALILALFVVLGIIIAFAVLLIRVALIIGCVIFLPVALVAWILPGTQRYFKLLWDNFIRALLLFPLIMGMVYVGRIFAWIIGSSGSANGSGTILAIFAVVIGFFGPYFLFPKAFRWGGNIMSAAASGIESGVNKLGEKPKKYIGDRREELKHQRAISSANRLRDWDNKKLSRRQKLGSIIRGDKFKSGDWDPAYKFMPISRNELKRQQAEKSTRFRAQAVRAENEEREFAMQKLEEEASHQDPGNTTAYYRKVWEDHSRSQSERFAALDLLADRGGDSDRTYILEQGNIVSASGNTEESSAFDKFMSRKASTLFPIMPNSAYYKGGGDADQGAIGAAKALKAANFARLGTGASADMLDRLTTIASTAGHKDQADAQEALANFYDAYDQALSSETISPEVGPDLRRAVNNRRPGSGPGAATVPAPPPTVVPPADIHTPDATGWTPYEHAEAENATRGEYNAYKLRIDRSTIDPRGYPPLTPDEQQRFEQLRGAHPDW